VILIPETVWSTLLDEFARAAPNVERVAFLDGVVAADIGVVTTVTIPDADLDPGSYDVSVDAMSEAGQHLRRHHLARLAQVHTHGGTSVRHSEKDDRRAYSQRIGAVSIVIPRHALDRPSALECGVHVRTTDGWRPLRHDQAASLIRLVPSALDFRRPTCLVSLIATKERSAAGLLGSARRAGRWLSLKLGMRRQS
jgi:hypothetical protein